MDHERIKTPSAILSGFDIDPGRGSMAASSHHVACITDDPEAVDAFLTEVVGLEVHLKFRTSGVDMSRTAGWPESGGADITMYGKPPAVIVEVIAIPEELLGRVRPRIWLVSFATTDIAARIEASRQQGLDATEAIGPPDGGVDVSVSMVEVGGISWEFVNFGS